MRRKSASCRTRSIRPGWRRRSSDRKSTRLNSSHLVISYAVFCLKKKNQTLPQLPSSKTFSLLYIFFFFNDTATTEIYTLSLHDALPISDVQQAGFVVLKSPDIPSILVETAFISNAQEERQLSNPEYQARMAASILRSEEHTSELQSPCNLVCRLLLEKKKSNTTTTTFI